MWSICSQVELQSADVKCKDMQQDVVASKAQISHLEQCLQQAQVCSKRSTPIFLIHAIFRKFC